MADEGNEDRILWRRLDLPGHELAALSAARSGHVIQGTAPLPVRRRALRARLCRFVQPAVGDVVWNGQRVGRLESDFR